MFADAYNLGAIFSNQQNILRIPWERKILKDVSCKIQYIELSFYKKSR